ncbi:hypothetical protein MKW94_019422, partial [Papaver nudicaule]|nr:hypothetical protein [Papaver nudicaule]
MQSSCLYNGGWTRLQVKPDTQTFSSSSNLITKLQETPNSLSSTVSPQSSNSAITTSTSDDGGNHSGNFRRWIELVGEVLSTAFPIWVALACILGLLKPNSFNWVKPELTLVGITIIMLGVGMTLTIGDLREALAMPGFFLQYSPVPLSVFLVSKFLNLSSYHAAGLSCCPGGITASNRASQLGNVAFVVLMTAKSTISAMVLKLLMTPFLTAKLTGQFVAVDAAGLLMSLCSPECFCNFYVGVTSCTCCLSSSCMRIFLWSVLASLLKVDVSSARTISIEVGMQ